MSLTKPILIASGVGLIIYAGYRYFTIQTELLTNSNYEIVDIKIDSLVPDLQLNITVRFDNNSSVNIDINQIYLDVFLNDKNIGNVQQVLQSVIEPKSSSTISLIANLDYSKSFDIAKDTISGVLGIGGSKQINIKCIGTASVKSGLISTTAPLSFEKQFNL
jgi:LEA14-like dessication related protein